MNKPLNRYHFLALWCLGFAILLKLGDNLPGEIFGFIAMTGAIFFCVMASTR